MEKVYVAIGDDVQEGLATLEWTLRKWSSAQISIVILHADINRDYVYTYYGKLPASYVNDESVDFLKKCEQGKLNKILHQYIAFCGKVKTETLNIEKYDEPVHKRILQLISGLQICKLVMGITVLKSSSLKYNNLLNGLRHIQQKKPDFCELYLTTGGKLVFLKEEKDEIFIEHDQGEMVVKLNKKMGSLKGWIGKLFPENAKSPRTSPPSSTSTDSPPVWEKCAEEIEEYFNHLLISNADEESEPMQVSNDMLENSESIELDIPKVLNPIQKTEFLRIKIGQARDTIHIKRREAKENAVRCSKAEWTINLCTSRAADVEARLNEETVKRGDLEKDLNIVREELAENRITLEQNKSKLNSTLEIQKELSNKLKSATLAKSKSEEQLRKLIHKRGGMIQEIEKLRKQKDVMQRRIEFCRDKDAIEMVRRLTELSFSDKEFTAGEIRAGTENFSENCRIKCSGDFTNVYRARINHVTVAVKLYDSRIKQVSDEEFDSKVKVLNRVQHPHLVAMLGVCMELKCIVFEYMHQSCLRNVLFSNSRNKQPLNWHARVCIAAQVCSGLTFLHLTKPRPMVHGKLNLSNILLDHNNVAKLHGFRLDFSCNESDIRSDIQDFGSLVLQLLTGRNWCGFVDEVKMINEVAFMEVLDQRVGKWPLEVAMELARIAIRCSSCTNCEDGGYTGMSMVMEDIQVVRKKADGLAADVGCLENEFSVDLEDQNNIPSFFFCPILQDIMKNPHIAADGFSYELSAIKQWLDMGHHTSPLTNLDLQHNRLTPNRTLRSLIQDWHNKRSIPL